jgi:hypothetical protein
VDGGLVSFGVGFTVGLGVGLGVAGGVGRGAGVGRGVEGGVGEADSVGDGVAGSTVGGRVTGNQELPAVAVGPASVGSGLADGDAAGAPTHPATKAAIVTATAIRRRR